MDFVVLGDSAVSLDLCSSGVSLHLAYRPDQETVCLTRNFKHPDQSLERIPQDVARFAYAKLALSCAAAQLNS